MASRPVFLPTEEGPHLVIERHFDFPWASGFAEVQKKKNIRALHEAAHREGVKNLLEISTKSDFELGRKLSAFSLKIDVEGNKLSLESVYQGSKVFRESGGFPEVMGMPPYEAKRFIRENAKGDLIKFTLLGEDYPLSPKNAFYDWLYIKSLVKHSDWIREKVPFAAFTDIEFNPAKQVNCQARAFAEYLSLMNRDSLRRAAEDFSYFSSMIGAV